jgi:pimeloyl-ACP methyl ester carboxylesterase
MSKGSIVLVQGTGVRQRDLWTNYETVVSTAAACGINQRVMHCGWGDALGIEFVGRSIPDFSKTYAALSEPMFERRKCFLGLGLRNFFFDLIKRAATRFIDARRELVYQTAARAIGDILLYQMGGERIRSFIHHTILQAEPPVTVVAHSLGGVACVDLLAREQVHVDHLVTLGSQSSFLYELDIMSALRFGEALPDHFPPWLNVFDRNDFLSFIAEPVFRRVRDKEVRSGRPFPDSHSAYFTSEEVWRAVRQFVE